MNKDAISLLEMIAAESKIFSSKMCRSWLIRAILLAKDTPESQHECWIVYSALEETAECVTIVHYLPQDMTFTVPLGKVKDFIV